MRRSASEDRSPPASPQRIPLRHVNRCRLWHLAFADHGRGDHRRPGRARRAAARWRQRVLARGAAAGGGADRARPAHAGRRAAGSDARAVQRAHPRARIRRRRLRGAGPGHRRRQLCRSAPLSDRPRRCAAGADAGKRRAAALCGSGARPGARPDPRGARGPSRRRRGDQRDRRGASVRRRRGPHPDRRPRLLQLAPAQPRRPPARLAVLGSSEHALGRHPPVVCRNCRRRRRERRARWSRAAIAS